MQRSISWNALLAFGTQELVDLMVDVAKMDRAEINLRAFYLRDACLLPDIRRGRKTQNTVPQIATDHAIIILLACMDHGPHIRVHEAVRSLWASPFLQGLELGGGIKGASEIDAPCLGVALRRLIHDRITDSLGIIEPTDPSQSVSIASFNYIQVTQRGQVQLNYRERVDVYGSNLEQIFSLSNNSTLIHYSFAAAPLIFELADLVKRSQAEAVRHGVELNATEATLALSHPLQPEADPILSRKALRQVVIDLRYRNRIIDLAHSR